MEKPKRSWWRLLRDGAVASVFCAPLVVLFWPSAGRLGRYGGVLGLLVLTFWDENDRRVLAKWLLSAVLTVAWCFLLQGVPARWISIQSLVDRVSYGYGGFWERMIPHLLMQVVALPVAVGVSRKKWADDRTRRILQGFVLPVLALVIVGELSILRPYG